MFCDKSLCQSFLKLGAVRKIFTTQKSQTECYALDTCKEARTRALEIQADRWCAQLVVAGFFKASYRLDVIALRPTNQESTSESRNFSRG